MAEGFNLTTYYAKRIIGDTAAADAEKALLQTGDDITTDTWILHRTNRTDKLYGIKYKYDSNGHDKMEYYGKASNDNATAWIQFDTGDASFNRITIGSDYANTDYAIHATGDMNLSGALHIFPQSGNNNYNQGIRIHTVAAWALITLCGTDNTGDTGTSANSWIIGNNNGNFHITRNGASGDGSAYLRCVSNVWAWNGIANGSISGNAATATSTSRLTLISSNTASTSTNTYATNGLNVRWFSETEKLPGQPSQWGFLLTVATGDSAAENHQIFIQQADGSLYHRGTNSSSYTNPPAFKILIDGSNWYKQIFANKNISRSTLTVYDSTWAVTSGTDVFGLSFKDTGLTYTPSGGRATASSDTGDWRAWLTCEATTNTVKLNMRIDGSFQSDILYSSYIDAYGAAQPTAGKLAGLTGAHSRLYGNALYITNPTTTNDQGWIRVLGTGETDTVLEIATGDDGGAGEQIVCRQYNTSNAVARELKLLDTSGNTTIPGSLYFKGAGIYHVGSAATQRIIRIIDANDQYGTGVSIGAGGLAILGSGESANKMIDNLGYTGASEVTVISSDGYIYFYPTQNDAYDAASCISMTQNRLFIGVNGNTTRESGLYVQSGAGQIELFSAASATGTRGLWVAAHGTGSSKTIISADTNNNITYAGGAISGSLTRAGVSKSWYQGRDSAIIKTTSYRGYDAILSMKTTAGDWALGVYNDNIMYFTYILDSNYSSNSNTVTKQFIFNPDGTLTATTFSGALSGNASTATKLSDTPNNTTTFLRGDNTWTNTINNTIICIPPTTNMASNNMAFNGGIQVRENGGVAANQSAIEYGPRISFHWSNRIAKSITLHSDGKFYFRDQNGTTRSTIDANLTGTADVASKLGTANVGHESRPIYLAAGIPTATTWYHSSCSISGGNKANYPWHRFAYCTTGTGQWTDKTVIVIIHSRYNGGPYGMVKLSMRTNATNAAKSTSAVWIYRSGFAADDIKISAPTKTTGTDETISAYIKCGTYPRRIAYILEGSNLGWTLVSSNEPSDTTTSDKKGGTEINASVSGNNATDGTTVSYLNCPRVTKNANEHPGKNITSMQEFSSTSSNLPSSHFYYILEAQGDDTAYSVQLAMGETTQAIYYRAIQNNTYSGWNRIVTNSGSWSISVTGSSASCTGNSNTANYQNCVQTNEIRYARNGNMASANDLWQGWAFAEGKVAVINGWRFGNGNGALAPIYGSKIYNAIWNDFAEYRESDVFEGGRVLVSDGHGKLVLATERLQPAARVISDTFGCSVGQSDKAKTPIGVAGRVLVYPYQDRNNYKVGDCLCAAPNGTADIMTREEIINYPDRIIGIVDEIPTYEVWQQSLTNYKKKDNGEIDEIGEKNITDTKVNGRIWIYVR